MTSILIVDDKEENRYYLEALLKGNGFEVRSARHGAEALVLARQSAPDMVISDLLMPVMDGYTLLRHWKGDSRLKTIPFIVYTATYTEPEDERLALSLGADAFILKPAEPDDFLSRMQKVFSAKVVRPPASPGLEHDQEAGLLKVYSETLIRKLEEKTLQLEEANQALQRDLAERRLTEAALRESEAEFRTLADAVPQMVWVAAPTGASLYSNRHWSNYTGFGPQESAGEGWAKAIHPDDASSVRDAWRASLKSMTSYSAECRLRRSDGAYRWWLVRAEPMKDAAGVALKWFGTCTDIHDLKETQEQLQRSQRLDVVGQLTGGIAHDFNNILNVILANVEALEEEEDIPPEVSKRVGRISAAVQRATDLIRQLLAFSRRQPLRPQNTDINELVGNLGQLLHRALGAQIEINTVLADDLWTVNVDRSQLESALVNLCVNARDAMPGGGRLSIATRNVTYDAAEVGSGRMAGDYVLLAVSDTGTGIPPEALPKVFEPFFTTKEEGKGTGLGLSMVYGFIRQSKGYIDIESEVGAGTTVKMLLPRIQAAPAEMVSTRRPALARGSERLLVVEDDAEVRAGVVTQLKSLGYEVEEAADGAAGLAACLAAPQPFDLLLTDVIMPGALNGRLLAEEVTRRWADTRIVFMSGYAPEAIFHDGRLDPGIHLLSKPFRKVDLASIIREALDRPGKSE